MHGPMDISSVQYFAKYKVFHLLTYLSTYDVAKYDYING